MGRHDGLLGVISILLVISMFIGLWSVLSDGGYAQPENPLGGHAALIPDVLDGGGNLAGDAGEDTQSTLPPMETEPPTEPEDSTEPEETLPEETKQPEPEPDEDET